MNQVIQELQYTRMMYEEDLIRTQHEIMQSYQILYTLPQEILEANIYQFIPPHICQDVLENPGKAQNLFNMVHDAFLRRNQVMEEKEDEVENQNPNTHTPEKVQVQPEKVQVQHIPQRPRQLPIDVQKQQPKKFLTKKFKK